MSNDERKLDAPTIELELGYRAVMLTKDIVAAHPLASARLNQYHKAKGPKRALCPYCYITKAETEALEELPIGPSGTWLASYKCGKCGFVAEALRQNG